MAKEVTNRRTTYRSVQVPAEKARTLDQRYAEGYRRRPEKQAWGRLGAKLLANRFALDLA